jgi:hypothetical protein
MFEGPPEQVLSALKPHFTQIDQPAHNVVQVTTEAHRIPQAIFDIGNCGVRITDIDIKKPTLEDVFLQIARGDHQLQSSPN